MCTLCKDSGLVILGSSLLKEVKVCPLCHGSSAYSYSTPSDKPSQIIIPEVSDWEILQAKKIQGE